MININVNKTEISVSNRETLAEGNVNSIFVKFAFSDEWSDVARIAVFTNGETSRAVSLSTEACAIPWEVLSFPGELYISMRGISEGGTVVICTKDKSLGRVEKSKANAEVPQPEEATPTAFDALLSDMEEMKSIIENLDLSSIEQASGDYATESFVRSYHDSTKQDTIADIEEIRTNAESVSGKENAGKITINGTEKTATSHTLSWINDGVTYSYEVVTV